MISPYAPSPLLFAARDQKHRPASHPLVAAAPLIFRTEGEWYAYVAARIFQERKHLGWSQRRLGRALGVSSVTVCHWERGNTRPTAWHVERLERVLGGIRP